MSNYDEAIKIVDKIYNKTNFTKEELQPLIDYLNKSETTEKEHEALKKQPTVDEVCNAYRDYLYVPLTYNNNTKTFEEIKGGRARGRIIARLFIDKVDIPHKLPIHLITMIGRFYEGLEVKE